MYYVTKLAQLLLSLSCFTPVQLLQFYHKGKHFYSTTTTKNFHTLKNRFWFCWAQQLRPFDIRFLVFKRRLTFKQFIFFQLSDQRRVCGPSKRNDNTPGGQDVSELLTVHQTLFSLCQQFLPQSWEFQNNYSFKRQGLSYNFPASFRNTKLLPLISY